MDLTVALACVCCSREGAECVLLPSLSVSAPQTEDLCKSFVSPFTVRKEEVCYLKLLKPSCILIMPWSLPIFGVLLEEVQLVWYINF